MGTAFFVHERAIPQGECLGNIQASEPQSGWDGFITDFVCQQGLKKNAEGS